MEIEERRFREVLARFASGVTVVTTLDGGRPRGVTVNAFASLSLDPPLVLVALERRRTLDPVIRRVGRYAVNVLAAGQEALSDCFAGAAATPGREAFCGAPWRAGPAGLPLLEGSLAAIEAEVADVLQLGDHDLFIGRVLTLATDDGVGGPLVYYRRRYVRLEAGSGRPVLGREEGPA